MDINFKNLSQNESSLLRAVKNEVVFTPREIQRSTGWKKRKIYNTLARLKKKKVVEMVEEGKYILKGRDVFKVATELIWPSYLSFWSALYLHDLTTQVPRRVFVLTTKQKEEVGVGGERVEFIKVKSDLFFGYKEEEYLIAEREKAILDSLYLPKYAGGYEMIEDCILEAWDDIDKEKLVEYAVRIGNNSLVSRLGFLIEKNELRTEEKLIEELLDHRSKTYVKIFEGKQKNRKWRVKY